MGEGSYFGEIGCLITQKRTVAVKAKTICIFFVIKKEDLNDILDHFPMIKKFLMAVAK